MATTTQPTQAQTTVTFISDSVVYGGIGALSAWALTSINPIAGAIFGVTSAWGSHIVTALNESMKCTNDTPMGKIAAYAISVFGGIALGALITTLMGFPLTFTAGLILTGASVVAGIAASLIAGACISSSALAFVAVSK